MRVLVTGGAGYIGSHACQRLLRDGHHVVALDSLVRGHRAPMDMLKAEFGDRFTFVQADLGDRACVRGSIDDHDLTTVMHFGALAYVGESVDHPLWYYRNNISSGLSMLEAIDEARDGRGVDQIIFSSSCATYGNPPEGMIPVPENCPQHPTSPYGRTKLHFEDVLLDYAEKRRKTGNPLSLTMLRYFNVAGCDRTGVLGEDHTPETHLVPVAMQAAQGKRPSMSIFGTDYPTPDGTCVRDYVHVEDLVDAHVRAAERVKPGVPQAYNVGIGQGYSVRQILDSVRRVTGRGFEVIETGRRAGDAIALYNDPTKIKRELGWSPEITEIDAVVSTAWRWFEANPDGYAGA